MSHMKDLLIKNEEMTREINNLQHEVYTLGMAEEQNSAYLSIIEKIQSDLMLMAKTGASQQEIVGLLIRIQESKTLVQKGKFTPAA